MYRLSWFGINCSLNPWYTYHDIDTIIHHLQSLRISWIRWEFDFFNKSRNLSLEQYAIEQFTSHNITIIWVLCGIVPWTIDTIFNPQQHYTPVIHDISLFEIFVKKIVTDYIHHITHRQIRNEPNTVRFWISKPNPQAYVTLVHTISTTIKSLQHHAIILCGGIFYDPSQRFLPWYHLSFMKECMTLWIDDSIDIYTIHPYSLSCYLWYQHPDSLINNTIYNIHTRRHDSWIPINKPVRITEFWISHQRTLYTNKQIYYIYTTLYTILHNYNMPFFIRNICDFWNQRHWRWNPEKTFWLLTQDYHTKHIMQHFNDRHL